MFPAGVVSPNGEGVNHNMNNEVNSLKQRLSEDPLKAELPGWILQGKHLIDKGKDAFLLPSV